MRIGDRDEVLHITARTWGGHDYVQQFFDSWVKEGGFWAGEVRGKLVGLGKVTQLAPGEWWLEGLRVDPACRRKGIGTELSRLILFQALELRPVSLRLATADVNSESLRIIERVMGFSRVATYRFFLGEPEEPKPGPALIRPTAAEALAYLSSTEEMKAGRGLLASAWRFRNLDRRHVVELVRARYVFGFRRGRAVSGLLVVRPHRYRGNDLDIPFVGGSPAALRAFRSYLSRVARACGTEATSCMAASREMADACLALGMKPHPRIGSVLVYEYPI
jgi:GNAT superfamily N-acetyltransferase